MDAPISEPQGAPVPVIYGRVQVRGMTVEGAPVALAHASSRSAPAILEDGGPVEGGSIRPLLVVMGLMLAAAVAFGLTGCSSADLPATNADIATLRGEMIGAFKEARSDTLATERGRRDSFSAHLAANPGDYIGAILKSMDSTVAYVGATNTERDTKADEPPPAKPTPLWVQGAVAVGSLLMAWLTGKGGSALFDRMAEGWFNRTPTTPAQAAEIAAAIEKARADAALVAAPPKA